MALYRGNTRARTPACRGRARLFSRLMGEFRPLLCVALSLMLACLPLDIAVRHPLDVSAGYGDIQGKESPFGLEVEISEAHAFVPLAAGGAAAVGAGAAAAGISTESLILGVSAVLAAGTGIYLASGFRDSQDTWGGLWDGSGGVNEQIWENNRTENWDEDYQNGKFIPDAWRDGKTWNDLSDEEKEAYGNPAAWNMGILTAAAVVTGTWNNYFQNGDDGPEFNEDPPEDPEEAAKWWKFRNVMAALGVSGGAVALGEAASLLGGAAGDALHKLLFGDGTTAGNAASLHLKLQQPALVGGVQVPFMYSSGLSYEYGTVNAFIDSGSWYAFGRTSTSARDYLYSVATRSTDSGITYYGSTPAKVTYKKPRSDSNFYNVVSFEIEPDTPYRIGIADGNYFSSGAYSYLGNWSNGITAWANMSFTGEYVFLDENETIVGKLNNGIISDGFTWMPAQYGQMEGTPDELASAITNVNNWNNYITNNSGDVDGNTKAIVMPGVFTGADGEPVYQDYLQETPTEDVTPIPDDGPLPDTDPDPDPDPEPNPNPGTNEDFPKDYAQRVQELLAQPFDQLFPFCLIGDARMFFDKLSGVFEDENGVLAVQDDDANDYKTLSIDLSGFNVEGLEDFEIDLSALKDLGNMVRGPFTAAYAWFLLYGTFRFFLVRGGE